MSMFDGLLENMSAKGIEPRNGLMLARVKNNWKSDFPGMVELDIMMDPSEIVNSAWVPVMTAYAGAGYGNHWIPEIGDEVVVAFLMGDPSKPIVLGSLWNQKNKLPDDTSKDKNPIKRMKTKGGHELTFDDDSEAPSILLKSRKGLKLELADKDEVVTIAGSNGQTKLVMDMKNGKVSIESSASIELKAGSSTMKLDGQGQKAEVKATNISIEASVEMKLKSNLLKMEGAIVEMVASGAGKVEASGPLTIKGAIVKVN